MLSLTVQKNLDMQTSKSPNLLRFATISTGTFHNIATIMAKGNIDQIRLVSAVIAMM